MIFCCCCWVSVCIRYCGELLLPIISENQTEKNYFGTRIFSTVFLFCRWSLMLLLLYLLVWTLHFYTLYTREIILIIIIIAETKPHRTKNRYKQEEWNVTMTWFFIHWQLAFQSIFLSSLVIRKFGVSSNKPFLFWCVRLSLFRSFFYLSLVVLIFCLLSFFHRRPKNFNFTSKRNKSNYSKYHRRQFWHRFFFRLTELNYLTFAKNFVSFLCASIRFVFPVVCVCFKIYENYLMQQISANQPEKKTKTNSMNKEIFGWKHQEEKKIISNTKKNNLKQ